MNCLILLENLYTAET